MSCTSCKFLKIHDFIFPDMTKTMECTKYNKHLGFTNKKWQPEKINFVYECNIVNKTNQKVKIVAKNKMQESEKIGVFRHAPTDKYFVRVNDGGVYTIIATVSTFQEAEYIWEMFKNRLSYVKGIYWEKRRNAWVAKVWDKERKRYEYIVQSKHYMKCLEELRLYKGEKK